ncbi:hypothetical protein LR48_Vigan07g135100 [Vigna angularis]|uniref:Putative plant transposon protein domain-containing protein n=1 Tax=Phaseolus angularis TaxID=3914 RepID=A0A0L9UYJ0_PHAAN|nr:hypothetical protein LR48_Vigan07g135100 [Vigna angularis]
MERKAGLIPNFSPQFGEPLVSRNWRRLATYPTPANIAVVKEFYTNARRLGNHPDEDYLSYVRGHAIRYDPDPINRFLDTECVRSSVSSSSRAGAAEASVMEDDDDQDAFEDAEDDEEEAYTDDNTG